MKIGLQLPEFKWPGGPAEISTHLGRIARSAEEGGFYSLWVMDHFFQFESLGPVDDPMLESYTTLSYLAAVTQKMRLGALVTGVVYRHPGVLVKTVSTLDVLSGGRAYLGIGAAWYEREAQALGIPFPTQWGERFARLEETLQIVQQMWAGDRRPYQGRYYQLAEPINCPQPIARPHPPIMVGGMGEQKTLRLVAKYADACNFVTYVGMEALQRKLEILKRYCDEVGREYNEIERTVLGGIDLGPAGMTPAEVIEWCRSLAQAGFQHVILNLPNVHEITPLEVLGREVIPAVAEF